MQGFLRTRFAHTKPYSVHSLADIQNSLYADHSKSTVYAGAQARMAGLTKRNPAHCAVYDWLAQKVYEYLNNGRAETKDSFDQWHHETCEGFIAACASAGITIAYGMAQKFLNLLLKYTYCFVDATTVVSTKFQYCHLTLDGYTYHPSNALDPRYLTTHTYGTYVINTPYYDRDVAPIAPTDTRTAWSKLSYEEYIQIQENIRTHLDLHPFTYADVRHLDTLHLATVAPAYPLTPFETEFFIW